jgi:hypothetical protein
MTAQVTLAKIKGRGKKNEKYGQSHGHVWYFSPLL